MKSVIRNDCLVSVGGDNFRIIEPWDFENLWSGSGFPTSLKAKPYIMRLHSAYSLETPYGQHRPFPAEIWSDCMIFSKEVLLDSLEKDERVEVDDSYLAGDPEFVKCLAGVLYPEE